jgi:hypothetical protein
MSNPWRKVLTHWQKNEGRHALTLSFLIGALRTPPGEMNVSEQEAFDILAAVLEEAAQSPTGKSVLFVYRCPTLGELVVRSVDGTARPAESVRIVPEIGYGGAFFASDTGLPGNEATSFELAEVIWREIRTPVLAGAFSCNGGRYAPFSSYDLQIISRAFA